MDRERFVRQLLVTEIGDAGQRAIALGEACVSGPTLAHEVAKRYARGAGFERLTDAAPELDAGVAPAWVEDPSARAVVAGARAALRAIVAAVGQPATGQGKADGD